MKNPANFRDLGGLANRQGQAIKPHRLLRSGELTDLSAKESDILSSQYNVKSVVDFRSTEEAVEAPDVPIRGAKYHNIDILKNAGEYISSFANFHEIEDRREVIPFMNEVYTLMIRDADATAGFRQFLQIVLDQEDGAVLYHCFAGKDRTGIATAILLAILDVDRQTILADYMRTNEMRRAINETLLQKDRERGYTEEKLEILESFLLVEPVYLETAFAVAQDLYGSFNDYISRALGVTDAGRQALRQRYLG